MIALITPTGGRPDQFSLCSKWMNNQTYEGDVVWVIVDDCIPITTKLKETKENWIILHEHPRPLWKPGQNSQARNISVGIIKLLLHFPKNQIDAIFIIEDDDYYSPEYLERMVPRIKGYWAVGEKNSMYYNVMYRKYQVNRNTQHSSLFQTAFTWEALPLFEACYSEKYIDLMFWRHLPPGKGLLFDQEMLSIGMKGMPGRGGIGAGHGKYNCFNDDSDLNYLKSLIRDDYKHYEKYFSVENPVNKVL